jgi:hypothetical protein
MKLSGQCISFGDYRLPRLALILIVRARVPFACAVFELGLQQRSDLTMLTMSGKAFALSVSSFLLVAGVINCSARAQEAVTQLALWKHIQMASTVT